MALVPYTQDAEILLLLCYTHIFKLTILLTWNIGKFSYQSIAQIYNNIIMFPWF